MSLSSKYAAKKNTRSVSPLRKTIRGKLGLLGYLRQLAVESGCVMHHLTTTVAILFFAH